jgi:putative DNA primase/helicase
MSSNFSNPSQNIADATFSNIKNWCAIDYAELYYKHHIGKYLWSDKTGWYSYNKNNILVSYDDEPHGLYNDITLFIRKYIKDEMANLKIDNIDYKNQHKDLLSAYDKKLTSHFLSSIKKHLNMFYYIEDLDDKIDARQDLFSFKNKVYDIKKAIYRDIEKTDYICRNTGYDVPTITKDFSIINDLLFSIFEDKEVCDYFLTTTAMSLHTNRFEKLYIMTGNGRNGKGVLSSIIQKAMGNYYLTANNDLLTTKDEFKSPTLAKAKGIRYMAISEPASDANGETKFNIPMVKKLTGRDIINVRALYDNGLEYLPEFTIFISCNKQPTVDETNEAIKNRFRFIHFPFTFVDNPTKPFERKIDVELKDSIDNDTEYRDTMICYLLHLVSQDYSKKKIKEPVKSTEFTKEYFNDNNDVGLFIEKYFTTDETYKNSEGKEVPYKVKSSELFNLYNQDGEYKKITSVKFAEALKNNNINKKRLPEGCFYIGLKRIPEPEKKPDDLNDI